MTPNAMFSCAVSTLGALAAVLLPGNAGTAAEPPATTPRAARSVHLGYPAPDGVAFYTEMIVDQSTSGSYFMACGWNTGYFGIQELPEGRRIALFSVWDPSPGDDPDAVRPEDRVELLHSDPDARIRRFGGEGTGGQCMIDFHWQAGGTNRFLVLAKPDGTKTTYAGFVHGTSSAGWKHLVSFRTRTGGQPLKGYYSFVEDFRRDTRSVGEVRRARFGNGWVKTAGGDWVGLLRARFTASSAEWESKENIDAGLEEGWYYLATGGHTRRTRPLQSVLERSPSPLPLPSLPNK